MNTEKGTFRKLKRCDSKNKKPLRGRDPPVTLWLRTRSTPPCPLHISSHRKHPSWNSQYFRKCVTSNRRVSCRPSSWKGTFSDQGCSTNKPARRTAPLRAPARRTDHASGEETVPLGPSGAWRAHGRSTERSRSFGGVPWTEIWQEGFGGVRGASEGNPCGR